MKTSNEIHWSYLAGLFDGEGTVCISTSHNKNNTTIFQMNVKVANTKLELMQWLISNFGGMYSISLQKTRTTAAHNTHGCPKVRTIE